MEKIIDKRYRITTRSVVLIEYIVRANDEEEAADCILDGAWESEDVVDYANEEILSIEDIALEVN